VKKSRAYASTAGKNLKFTESSLKGPLKGEANKGLRVTEIETLNPIQNREIWRG
jgi:hypothetical protein